MSTVLNPEDVRSHDWAHVWMANFPKKSLEELGAILVEVQVKFENVTDAEMVSALRSIADDVVNSRYPNVTPAKINRTLYLLRRAGGWGDPRTVSMHRHKLAVAFQSLHFEDWRAARFSADLYPTEESRNDQYFWFRDLMRAAVPPAGALAWRGDMGARLWDVVCNAHVIFPWLEDGERGNEYLFSRMKKDGFVVSVPVSLEF